MKANMIQFQIQRHNSLIFIYFKIEKRQLKKYFKKPKNVYFSQDPNNSCYIMHNKLTIIIYREYQHLKKYNYILIKCCTRAPPSIISHIDVIQLCTTFNITIIRCRFVFMSYIIGGCKIVVFYYVRPPQPHYKCSIKKKYIHKLHDKF